MALTANEREEILNTISDLTKAACGFRVRKNFGAMTDEELEAEYAYYWQEAEYVARRERIEQEKAQLEWETHITGLMVNHGLSKADAIRWDMQAMGVDKRDVGYYCYLHGMGYSLEHEIEEIL